MKRISLQLIFFVLLVFSLATGQVQAYCVKEGSGLDPICDEKSNGCYANCPSGWSESKPSCSGTVEEQYTKTCRQDDNDPCTNRVLCYRCGTGGSSGSGMGSGSADNYTPDCAGVGLYSSRAQAEAACSNGVKATGYCYDCATTSTNPYVPPAQDCGDCKDISYSLSNSKTSYYSQAILVRDKCGKTVTCYRQGTSCESEASYCGSRGYRTTKSTLYSQQIIGKNSCGQTMECFGKEGDSCQSVSGSCPSGTIQRSFGTTCYDYAFSVSGTCGGDTARCYYKSPAVDGVCSYGHYDSRYLTLPWYCYGGQYAARGQCNGNDRTCFTHINVEHGSCSDLGYFYWGGGDYFEGQKRYNSTIPRAYGYSPGNTFDHSYSFNNSNNGCYAYGVDRGDCGGSNAYCYSQEPAVNGTCGPGWKTYNDGWGSNVVVTYGTPHSCGGAPVYCYRECDPLRGDNCSPNLTSPDYPYVVCNPNYNEFKDYDDCTNANPDGSPIDPNQPTFNCGTAPINLVYKGFYNMASIYDPNYGRTFHFNQYQPGDYNCWVRKSCGEVTATCLPESNCTTSTSTGAITGVFTENVNDLACVNDNDPGSVSFCGTCCTTIAPPIYQTVGGNLYAAEKVVGQFGYDGNLSGNEANYDEPFQDNFPNPYLAREAGSFNPGSAVNNSSGVPMAGGETISNTNSLLTQRSAVETKVTASKAYPELRREDFAYYQSQVQYDALPLCEGNNWASMAAGNGLKVNQAETNLACKVEGDLTITGSHVLGNDFDKVIFVEDNLLIGAGADFATVDDTQIVVPAGAFLAFIVQGDIIVEPSVGTSVIVDSAGNPLGADTRISREIPVGTYGVNPVLGNPRAGDYVGYNWADIKPNGPDLQGIYLASGEITFKSFGDDSVSKIERVYNNVFTNMPCDNILTLGGSFLGWGGVNLDRTLKGCMDQPLEVTGNQQIANIDGKYQLNAPGGVQQYQTNYIDLNEIYQATTVLYRPDLVMNTPIWMREIVDVREETI